MHTDEPSAPRGRRIERRLAELGIELPEPPNPLAAYSSAARSGRMAYSSGQLPMVNGELVAAGLVAEGGGVDPQAARECARACAINALAALSSVIELDSIARIVKVNAFVASATGFTGQPAVVDGCSELLVEVFGETGRHARSAVGVASLPLGAPVEIDIIVEVGVDHE